MSYTVEVENIKCGGCANSIRNKLNQIEGIQSIEVDIEQGRVSVDGEESTRQAAIDALAHMGYPETGSVEGLKAAASKAKSFVSCAIGRLDNMTK